MLRRYRAQACGLRDPWTSEPLELVVLDADAVGTRHGLLVSSSHTYALVFGIAILREELSERYVPLLEARRFDALREHVLAETETLPEVVDEAPVPLFSLAERLLAHIETGAKASFDMTPTREWLLQLAYWHATRKAVQLIPFQPYLDASAPRRLLDLGSGIGHAAYLAASGGRTDAISLVDANLAQLLASPWVLGSTRTQLVCADLEQPLPFRDGEFDLVLSCDALHYLENKEVAAAEIARLRSPHGAFLGWHLHDAQHATPRTADDKALSQAGWSALFKDAGLNVRLYNEADLERSLAAETPWSPAVRTTLEGAETLACFDGPSEVATEGDAWFQRPPETAEILHPGFAHIDGTAHPVPIQTTLPSEYARRRSLRVSPENLPALRRNGAIVRAHTALYGPAAASFLSLSSGR